MRVGGIVDKKGASITREGTANLPDKKKIEDLYCNRNLLRVYYPQIVSLTIRGPFLVVSVVSLTSRGGLGKP